MNSHQYRYVSDEFIQKSLDSHEIRSLIRINERGRIGPGGFGGDTASPISARKPMTPGIEAHAE